MLRGGTQNWVISSRVPETGTREVSRSVEIRSCPLCKSQDSRPIFDIIRRCGTCEMCFASPLNNHNAERETKEYFLTEYLPSHQRNWENSVNERRAHLAAIRRYAAMTARPRLLDVGCALGLMLSEARQSGWEAMGVEVSDFAAMYAAEHTGCQVQCGTLEEAAFRSASFDAVTLMDVVEHVPE